MVSDPNPAGKMLSPRDEFGDAEFQEWLYVRKISAQLCEGS